MAFDICNITNESHSLVVLDVTDCRVLRKQESIAPGIYWSNRAVTLVKYTQEAIKIVVTSAASSITNQESSLHQRGLQHHFDEIGI